MHDEVRYLYSGKENVSGSPVPYLKMCYS